jgi:hypothetical protein
MPIKSTPYISLTRNPIERQRQGGVPASVPNPMSAVTADSTLTKADSGIYKADKV